MRRNRSQLASLLVLVAALAVTTSSAQATKFYDSTIGTSAASSSGTPPTPSSTAFGGFFGTGNGGIGDVAVNDPSITSDGTGQSGWVYVVDPGSTRIQAFDSAGAFQWAVGRDTIAASVNEAQALTIRASGGQFRLKVGASTTGDLDFNISAAAIDNALDALVGGVDANIVATSGAVISGSNPIGRYAIAFQSAFGAANQAPIEVLPGTTPLAGTATITTVADGAAAGTTTDTGTGFEKCQVAGHCKAGVAAGLGGELSAPQGIDIDQSTGHLFVRDRGNNRVQEFEADGDFVRAFGRDVVQPGGDGETAAVFDERQTVTITAPGGGQITGGSFRLSFGATAPTQTDPISWEADAQAVEDALVALGDIGPGDVEVSGGPAGPAGGTFVVEFVGALAGTDVAQMSAMHALTDNSAINPPAIAVTTPLAGGVGPGFETCTNPAQCKAGQTAPLAGMFGASSTTSAGLAVAPAGAPAAGDVFAVDPANTRILGFGVLADPDAPVVPRDPIGSAAVFGSSARPVQAAVDANGVLYADSASSGSGGGGIVRYDLGAEDFLEPISPDLLPTPQPTGGLEYDPGAEHLLVGPGSSGARDVRAFDLSTKPATVDESHIADKHVPSGLLSAATNALGVNPVTGKYYVSISSGGPLSTGIGQRLLAIDDDGLGALDVVLLPPTDVEATTATLHATIDPNGPTGFPASYRFELSNDGIDWQPATADELVPPDGESADPVAVQAPVTALEANANYRVRIVATRADGSKSISAELFFLTDPGPPLVETLPARQVSDVSAQLVGRLSPGGLATDYWFEWGDTDLANTIPAIPAAASGGNTRLVGELLAGLVPERVYRYRLCARNSLSATKVCGATADIETRSTLASPAAGRAFEMATSPDKPLRRGGERGGTGVPLELPDTPRLQDALASPDSPRLLWSLFAGATAEDAGTGFSWDRNRDLYARQPGGSWLASAVYSAPLTETELDFVALADLQWTSPSFNVIGIGPIHPLFASAPDAAPNAAHTAVRDMDRNDGGPLSAGWYPWITSDWAASTIAPGLYRSMAAQTDRAGGHVAAMSGDDTTGTTSWREVTPADGGPAPQTPVLPGGAVLDPPQTAGRPIFTSSRQWDWRPADLVNECTGTVAAGDQTLIPQRVAGAPADTIGARGCEQGSPVDTRGAGLGANTTGLIGQRLGNATATAMSEHGDRVFFASPDPDVAADTCATGTGSATTCPPQLFVRHYENPDDTSTAMVRWLSRSRSLPAPGEPGAYAGGQIAGQQVGLFGSGAVFEGASRDGSVVYFRTDAPLTPDDPNGGPLGARPVVAGNASNRSWDLYRYELPQGAGADPDDGLLTRVSGGPDGDADPNTNCAAVATSGPDTGGCSGTPTSAGPGGVPMKNGSGEVVRFLSDDGERVYFVTTARIPAADNVAPDGSSADNLPTAASAQLNGSTRNLYSYDASDRSYRFVARLPFSRDGGLNSCASNGGQSKGPVRSTTIQTSGSAIIFGYSDARCFYGSRAGDVAVFETDARLTDDDDDDAYDLYLYDAVAGSLTRVSAPPPGVSPYVCLQDSTGSLSTLATCNGDIGYTNFATPPLGYDSPDARNFGILHDAQGRFDALVFQSRLPLAAGAAPDDTLKIYQWRRDGRVELISPADAGDSMIISGNSADGTDVYFWTEQRISPWEAEDSDGDIYNATTRTDLHLPPPPPAICAVLADRCQGGGSGSIAGDVKTSDSSEAENVTAGARKTLALSGPSARARRKASRTGRLSIAVRASSTGRVTLTVKAKLGQKAARVGRATRQVSKAGRVNVSVRLSSAARKRLRAGKKLRLTIEARQSGARSRAISILLPGAKP